ncbi:ribosomal protein S18 acetylase RimI-like enzyme [Sinobacterium caligoides]|uniref:Ribosomal protein S18 acetylase RimI-like enzyme n=1 Tax=Sinobacterium caligoides TaxID=933926 RepID=A0A3N2DR32_9GAMM|nr:GNAT family N-acetyltransferase [Sinobacterium caligoides]ROS02059.1 ribosomal protein S18 acetylase RimI-like enzyme [Sinobacterium caligoides]
MSKFKKIVVRQYVDGDFDRVSEIHDLARPIELQGSCDAQAFITLADDRDGLSDFQQSQKLVAVADDVVMGFVGISGAEVSWLYVDPTAFGSRIGAKLLLNAFAAMDHIPIAYVLAGNVTARKFYHHFGFQEVTQFDSDNNGYPCRVIKLQMECKNVYPTAPAGLNSQRYRAAVKAERKNARDWSRSVGISA